MINQIGTKQYYYSDSDTKGDVIWFENMIPIDGTHILKVDIGEVPHHYYHVLLQAIFLLKNKGIHFYLMVRSSLSMKSDVLEYGKSLGLKDNLFFFDIMDEIEGKIIYKEIEIDRYLGDNIFVISDNKIIDNTINSICSVLEE